MKVTRHYNNYFTFASQFGLKVNYDIYDEVFKHRTGRRTINSSFNQFDSTIEIKEYKIL